MGSWDALSRGLQTPHDAMDETNTISTDLTVDDPASNLDMPKNSQDSNPPNNMNTLLC